MPQAAPPLPLAVVGPLSRPVAVVDAAMRCGDLDLRFRADTALPCVAVLYLDGATGLISRDRFAQLMSGPFGYGRALWEKTPVGRIADTSPVIVPSDAPVVDVCDRIGRRDLDRRYDDVLVRFRDGRLGRVSAAQLYEALAALMAHQAIRDPLSGLANRAHFLGRLEAACREPGQWGIAVVFVDLDRMKQVNDTLGHNVGDRLIVSAARRLRAAARPEDVVARLGGDEFAVLCRTGGLSGLSAAALGERFRLAISTPDPELPAGVQSVASVGVAVGAAGADAETLLTEADMAMYRAKRAGGDAVRIVLDVGNQLSSPVTLGALRLFYQPIVGTADGLVHSVEALVRWQHPRLGLLTPDRFLSDLHRAGQLPALDRWVLERACADLAWWDAQLGPRSPRYVNVNVTVESLRSPDIATQVLGALDRAGVDPERLRIELPETADLAALSEVIQQLRRLRAYGIGIVLDDMGAGSATLRHLSVLPVTGLKIDRSFVGGMLHNRNDHAVIRLLADLGHNLNLHVTAEGIENEAQLDRLRQVGIPYAQGFHLSRPAPADELAALLRTGRTDSPDSPDSPVGSLCP